MKHTYAHIDLDERPKIARWRMIGLSVGIIAEKFGRHHSTIFRELKSTVFVDAVVPDGVTKPSLSIRGTLTVGSDNAGIRQLVSEAGAKLFVRSA